MKKASKVVSGLLGRKQEEDHVSRTASPPTAAPASTAPVQVEKNSPSMINTVVEMKRTAAQAGSEKRPHVDELTHRFDELSKQILEEQDPLKKAELRSGTFNRRRIIVYISYTMGNVMYLDYHRHIKESTYRLHLNLYSIYPTIGDIDKPTIILASSYIISLAHVICTTELNNHVPRVFDPIQRLAYATNLFTSQF
jgi:hypothetical protein